MGRLETLNKIKKAADAARAEHDRAAGALEQAMARLKSEHGCDSIEEARAKLQKLERRTERLGLEFDSAVAELETQIESFGKNKKDSRKGDGKVRRRPGRA